MKLITRCFQFIGLVGIIIVLNACGTVQNQTPNLPPSSISVTSTLIPITLTPTMTPTTTSTASPTSWIIALLTTTPTMYPMPTLPPDCGTVRLGSAGTQTIDNPQKILIQGTAILCGQIYFSPVAPPKTISVIEGMIDLDNGKIDFASADIEFCPGGGSMIFYGFCDMNNAFVRVYSLNGLTMEHAKEPTLDECQNITAPYGNDHDNEPEYACVITKQGNISRIKVEQYNPLGKNVMSLEISFVTWKK